MTIDEALGIEVTTKPNGRAPEWRPNGKDFFADAKKLPGSPVTGRGSSAAEAKFDLLAQLMWDRANNGDSSYGPIVDDLLRAALHKGR